MTRPAGPLTVGLLTQWYDPEPGPASIPGVLARGLVARGHTVKVVTGYPNYPTGTIYPGFDARGTTTLDVDGVSVRRVPLYASHDASALRRLANYLSFSVSAIVFGLRHLRDCDVVWVYNSPPTIGMPMAVLRLLLRKRLVLHVMDLWPDSLFASGFAPEGGLSGLAMRAVTAWCRMMYSLSDAVAYISPSVGAVLRDRGVPARRLTFAPVWTDETVFRPLPRIDRETLQVPDGHLVVLYAGAIGAPQGLTTLVNAMVTVRNLPITCLLAGDGTDVPNLERIIADEGLENVRLLGRVPKSEISDLMAFGDVHVISLRQTPLGDVSLPSKLQATMASARPVLAIASGDLADVVRRSEGGFVTPPDDVARLAALLADIAAMPREGLAAKGQKARDYYDLEYSSAAGIDRVESLLHHTHASRTPQRTRRDTHHSS